MKLLLDQDAYDVTARCLEEIGHDITRVATVGLYRASDEEILDTANRLGPVLVTRDRDFGHLVFVRGTVSGVIYPRKSPSAVDAVHAELATLLSRNTEQQLGAAFVLVTQLGHRIRANRC